MLTRTGNVQTSVLQLKPSTSEASLCSAKPKPSVDDLLAEECKTLHSQIPSNYHDFLDVFSKTHNLQYDHHIKIEEGKQPPLGPIYNTSETEAEALCNFLKENLNTALLISWSCTSAS